MVQLKAIEDDDLPHHPETSSFVPSGADGRVKVGERASELERERERARAIHTHTHTHTHTHIYIYIYIERERERESERETGHISPTGTLYTPCTMALHWVLHSTEQERGIRDGWEMHF